VPIVAADIHLRLSGGAANTNANASLGGAKSSTSIVDNVLNNLWDNVTGLFTVIASTVSLSFF
jgi:hypothetical protein